MVLLERMRPTRLVPVRSRGGRPALRTCTVPVGCGRNVFVRDSRRARDGLSRGSGAPPSPPSLLLLVSVSPPRVGSVVVFTGACRMSGAAPSAHSLLLTRSLSQLRCLPALKSDSASAGAPCTCGAAAGGGSGGNSVAGLGVAVPEEWPAAGASASPTARRLRRLKRNGLRGACREPPCAGAGACGDQFALLSELCGMFIKEQRGRGRLCISHSVPPPAAAAEQAAQRLQRHRALAAAGACDNQQLGTCPECSQTKISVLWRLGSCEIAAD